MIHMRHEQTCAYAADAWARTTGTPRRARGDGGLRADQRRDGALRRGPRRQPGRLPLRPAPDHRGRPRLLPGSVRRRHLSDLLEVHQTRARLVDARIRPAPRLPRGDEPASGARRARVTRPTSSIARTTLPGSCPVLASTRPASSGARPTPTRSSAPSTRSRAPSGPSSSRATASSGPTPAPSSAPSRARSRLPVYTRRTAQGALPRGRSACRARGVEEALHRSRRRRARRRLPLLERRALRTATHLERRRHLYSGRRHAGARRLARAGGDSDGRRPAARPPPAPGARRRPRDRRARSTAAVARTKSPPCAPASTPPSSSRRPASPDARSDPSRTRR